MTERRDGSTRQRVACVALTSAAVVVGLVRGMDLQGPVRTVVEAVFAVVVMVMLVCLVLLVRQRWRETNR